MNDPAILRGAPNNSAIKVDQCEPWTFKPNVPPEALQKRATYVAWRAHPQTEHLVYTGWEAASASVRANVQTNPVRRLHAIIADFDDDISDAEFNSVLERSPVDLRPTWIHRTNIRNGARLIWMFDQPLPLEVGALLKPFFKIVAKALQLTKLLPALDEAAFFNGSTKLYDVGHGWKKLGDYTLHTNLLHFWLTEAAKATRLEIGELTIPIEKVAAEVENRWPGRWPGEFVVGARGPALQNPDSVNPTAAIVTESGLICFGEPKLFYSWSEILGLTFVRQFQQDKIGAAVAATWYDGASYYRKIDGLWVKVSTEAFIKYLSVAKDLDPVRREQDKASETSKAEVFLHENRRIHGAIPFLYDPRDMIVREGQKFLNTSYVRAMQPADIYTEWGVNFPWIAEFLDTFFHPYNQLDYYNAWFKRYYGSALAGKLERGQNVFIVGPVEIGKTLLAHRIIGAAMGGSADASDYALKGSDFNKKLGEMPLWTIDDGQVATDPAAHRKFGEMVKRIAANPTMNFHKKYSDAETIDWAGRLIVTLNNDVYSLQLIPDLSSSLEDKVLIFNVAAVKRKFPKNVETIINAELPHYLRWILEWTPPAHVVNDGRFGVNRYVHDELRAAAMHSGKTGELLELVAMWIKIARPDGEQWKGTSTDWFAAAMGNDLMKPLLSKSSPRIIGRQFSEASRIDGTGITVAKPDKHNGHVYAIALPPRDGKRNVTRYTPELPA